VTALWLAAGTSAALTAGGPLESLGIPGRTDNTQAWPRARSISEVRICWASRTVLEWFAHKGGGSLGRWMDDVIGWDMAPLS
jgi:hypothetical protein